MRIPIVHAPHLILGSLRGQLHMRWRVSFPFGSRCITSIDKKACLSLDPDRTSATRVGKEVSH
jgi:hypothetical protein